jgi:hypothetical protein
MYFKDRDVSSLNNFLGMVWPAKSVYIREGA